MFRDHAHYAQTQEFIALYDKRAFDPALDIEPISTFEPMLRRLMASPKNSVYKAAVNEVPQP